MIFWNFSYFKNAFYHKTLLIRFSISDFIYQEL
ncbi:unnamed protein product [Callosobruchus maculatus]|uniref:Uncharacterized protein n=1 Tax=Callosobruchus maculatus TaxID=64391 RepID=A0A653BZW7_CALMS|nr:unnamed protein product [Callosobruchus maculatus]